MAVVVAVVVAVEVVEEEVEEEVEVEDPRWQQETQTIEAMALS